MMYGLREAFEYFECSNCHCLQIKKIPEDMSKYYNNADYYSFNENKNSNHIMKSFINKKIDGYCLLKNSLLGKIFNYKYPNLFFSILRDLGINYDSKILDVGCGSGTFLNQLKNLNFKYLTGIDLYIKKEIKTENLQILQKSIQELSDDQKFDFIIFSHSFEHMENPFETLLKVRNILSDHGTCIIKIPIKTEYIWGLYGVNWVQIDAPRHFFIYSLKGFDILLKKTGFKLHDTIFDSTEFQFWGSEQYKRDIPLNSENSYGKNPKDSIFSKKDINEYKKCSKILNNEKLGDQSIFVLKKE